MDVLDMSHFLCSFEEKRGQRSVSSIAREIGVPFSLVQSLVQGVFEGRAFFAVCAWMEVSPRTFLADDPRTHHPNACLYQLPTGQICHIYQYSLEWCSVRVLTTDNPDAPYSCTKHGVRYEELFHVT